MATRRELLTRFAALGGVGAAFTVARELGLVGGEEAWAGAPRLNATSGGGAKVVVLGAGVAGLSAAYELGRAGYDCTLLEARSRVGGRVWTIRKDDVVEMTDGTRQVCGFGEGQYLNAGAGRIPSFHDATLGYCREFNVALETEVNFSGNARIQSDRVNGGKAVAIRQAVHDSRGYFAELLAKSVRNGGVDAAATPHDVDTLLAKLADWGALSSKGAAAAEPQIGSSGVSAGGGGSLVYNGTTSSGYAIYPGAGRQVGVALAPLSREVALDPFMLSMSNFHEIIDMQATMFQPVGGMDRVPMALKAQLRPGVLHVGAEVRKIIRTTSAVGKPGVKIVYFDKAAAQLRTVEADYCICTVPLGVLSNIDADFSKDRQAAISRAVYNNAIKVAFQSPRFWERDDQIYGGLSFTERDTLMTWYPSNDFQRNEGVLVAGYSFGGAADRFAALPLKARFAYARDTIERLHPGKSKAMHSGLTLTWKNIPYSLGIACPLDEQDPPAYALLSEPDGPFYFAGEHLSHVGAWQQGAIVSAHRSVTMLDAQHRGGQVVTSTRRQ